METGEQDQLRYMDVATAVLSLCLYYLYCCGPPHYGDSDPLGTSFPEAEREGKAATRRLPTSTFPVF